MLQPPFPLHSGSQAPPAPLAPAPSMAPPMGAPPPGMMGPPGLPTASPAGVLPFLAPLMQQQAQDQAAFQREQLEAAMSALTAQLARMPNPNAAAVVSSPLPPGVSPDAADLQGGG